MKILSRGQLANIIKTNRVESTTCELEGKLANLTIVYNKKKDSFHRVIWGEVIDKRQSHIWFNEFAEEVKIAPNGEWMTKHEMKSYQESLSVGVKKDFDELTLMKTNSVNDYSILNNKVSSSLIENRNILYISTEFSSEEISNRIIKVIAGNSQLSFEQNKASTEELNDLDESISLVENLSVTYEPLLNLDRIMKIIATNNKADLIVIDKLKLSDDNYKDVANVHKLVDNYAQSFDCDVLIYTEKV